MAANDSRFGKAVHAWAVVTAGMVLLLAVGAVEAANKCSIDKKIVYQQMPCPDSGELVGDEIKRREQERRTMLAQEQRRREQELQRSVNEDHAARDSQNRDDGSAAPYASRSHAGSSSAVHTGPRGGHYTISSSGRKNYGSRGRR